MGEACEGEAAMACTHRLYMMHLAAAACADTPGAGGTNLPRLHHSAVCVQ